MSAEPQSLHPSLRRSEARLTAGLSASEVAAVEAALAAHAERPGALLPVLHAIQDALGHVPPNSLPRVAHALNLSRAEVHGVVTFYPHFRSTPAGRSLVRLCRAEACQARGARALEAHAKRALGIDFQETTDDGAITLEPVYCLGNCACGPSLLVERRDGAGALRDAGELHAGVTPAAFDALVEALRTEAQA